MRVLGQPFSSLVYLDSCNDVPLPSNGIAMRNSHLNNDCSNNDNNDDDDVDYSSIHSLHFIVLGGHTGHKTAHNLINLRLTSST